MKPLKNTTLYSRLSLLTSVTLVVGYFVVYAAYQTFTSPEYQSGAALSSTFLGKVVSNLDEINGRVTTLEGSIAGASVWSKVGSDINYTAGKVGVGATTGNAELDIQSGIKPHWGIYHDSTTEELRFWNGDNRVVIGSTGNVGIGTESPAMKLQVVPNVNQYGLGIIGNNTVGQSYGQYIMAGTNSSDAAFRVVNQAQNAEYMYIRGDGNIGIGTTNPYAKIHTLGRTFMMGSTTDLVWGSVGTLFQGEFGAVSGNTYTKLESFIGGGSAYGNLVINPGGGNVTIGATTSYGKLDIMGSGDTKVDIGDTSDASRGLILKSGTAVNLVSTLTTNSVNRELVLGVNEIEYMRIKNNGNVGIGVSNPLYKLQLSTDSAAKPTSSTWSIASDMRIKKDINNFTDGLDTILALQPRTYKYNGGGGVGYDDAETHIGIVAQEVEKVAPYMVETRTGTIDGKEVSDFKTYQGHALPFILVNAVKELKSQKDSEVGELKSQILELKNEIQELKNK